MTQTLKDLFLFQSSVAVLLCAFLVVVGIALSTDVFAQTPGNISSLSATLNADETVLSVSGQGFSGCASPCTRAEDRFVAVVSYDITGPQSYSGPAQCYTYDTASYPGCVSGGAPWRYLAPFTPHTVDVSLWPVGTYTVTMWLDDGVSSPQLSATVTFTKTIASTGSIQVNSINSVTGAPVSSSGSVFGPGTFNYTNVASQTFSNATSGNYNFSVTQGSAGPLYAFEDIQRTDSYNKFVFGKFGFLKNWLGAIVNAFTPSSSCGSSTSCFLPGGGSISFTVGWVPEATLDLSPTTLNLTGTRFGSNPTGIVDVQNNGASGSTLNWLISGASQSWLSGSPSSGNGVAAGSSQNSTITADISGLTAGTYNGNTITFSGTSQPSGSSFSGTPVTINLTVNNPAPVISSLNPSTRQAGTGSFTIDVSGSNFVNDGNLFRLSWNGMNRPTTFISSTFSRMTVNATDILSPGTANIRASNPGPGGGLSNQVTFTITPGNTPPGTPTGTQALSPVAQGSNYCVADNRYQFNWTYSDPNGDPQGGYRVQVARDSGFTQIVDDSNPSDTPTSGGSSTSYTPLVGMPYNSTLYFRVKVWDNQGAVSPWSSTVSFATINHAYPLVTFSPPPPATVPANVVIQFTSGGTCYDSTGASVPCGSWAWNFGDGGISTQQNPGHIYATSSANTIKIVSHTVTDTSGQACTLQQNLNIGDSQNLPDWKEVGPL